MTFTSRAGAALLAAATLALAGCGGGTPSATISATVLGLATNTTMVLQDNGGDNYSLTGDGSLSQSFSFASTVDAGNNYAVTVLTQPLAQSCTSTAASGTVDSNGDSPAAVVFSCVANSYFGGTVTGVPSGNVFTMSFTINGNAGTPVTFTSNGNVATTFSAPNVYSGTYVVTGATSTNGTTSQTCTVTNNSGTGQVNPSAFTPEVSISCI